VRTAIYDGIVRDGLAPDVGGIAAAAGVTIEQAGDAMRALADGHVIVLEPGTTRIRFAAPFANYESGFRVVAEGRTWFAPCAWDAFGIPAALYRDAEIEARCARTGERLVCGVRNGRAYGSGVVHLLVPAARFWDDIVYT
jgi:hypothetical protein